MPEFLCDSLAHLHISPKTMRTGVSPQKNASTHRDARYYISLVLCPASKRTITFEFIFESGFLHKLVFHTSEHKVIVNSRLAIRFGFVWPLRIWLLNGTKRQLKRKSTIIVQVPSFCTLHIESVAVHALVHLPEVLWNHYSPVVFMSTCLRYYEITIRLSVM